MNNIYITVYFILGYVYSLVAYSNMCSYLEVILVFFIWPIILFIAALRKLFDFFKCDYDKYR